MTTEPDAVEQPTVEEPSMKTPAIPTLPPGTPWWGYLLAALIPVVIGGGSFLGFSFVSASEVKAQLEEHKTENGHSSTVSNVEDLEEKIEGIENDIESIGKSTQVNFTNILLLCRAQDPPIECITGQ